MAMSVVTAENLCRRRTLIDSPLKAPSSRKFYAAAPVCSPSRAGFLTGMYPGRWRITSYLQTRAGNRACEQADFLDPKAPCIGRAMKSAGYATAHFGKWHMGGGRDVTNAPPFSAYGFDEHAGTWESPEPDPTITATNWIWSKYDKVQQLGPRSAYFVDRTLDFLRRHKGEPCFVNLWPDDVHTPWVPKGTDLDHQNQEKEWSAVNFKPVLLEYDKQVGRLMAGLRELGIDNNTITSFFPAITDRCRPSRANAPAACAAAKSAFTRAATACRSSSAGPAISPPAEWMTRPSWAAWIFFPYFSKLAQAPPCRPTPGNSTAKICQLHFPARR